MKKFTIMALAVCLTVVMAAPVMAVDVDFSGDYRVRGFYTSHWDLRETSASNAYMNMRFELQTVFKASDILSVTTRFDALEDHVWGTTTDSSGNAGNVNFTRAYMTIKAPIGTFYVGRMVAGPWGTSFLDYEVDADRIKYKKVIDNLTLWAVFQKTTEKDNVQGTAGMRDDQADYDSDTYYLLGTYKMENTTAGLMLAFTNDKTGNDDTLTDATAAGDTADRTRRKYSAAPYFVSKFGPLAIQGELQYNWGQTDYDTAGSADLDIKELAYNLEATYNVGPASIMAGYAFTSGDNNAATDNEDSSFGGVGDDWEKLFILTTNEVNALVNLGGTTVGNLSNAGVAASSSTSGAKIIYGGATFSPLDNLELGVVVGSADADEAPAGYKDDYGMEYDFTLNWEIYDNLTYSAVAAFLEAGDYFKKGVAAPADFDDTYALFHQLELSF